MAGGDGGDGFTGRHISKLIKLYNIKCIHQSHLNKVV